MTKKKKPLRIAPLQRLAVKPIEDPAEQAALDARLKQSEEATSMADAGSGSSNRVTASLVIELCRQLPAKARLTVASELSAQLSLDERIKVLQRWASELPAEFQKHLTEGLIGRLEDIRERGSIDRGPTRSASGGR